MKPVYSSLAEFLSETGHTQEWLAADLKIRQGTISKWVRGDTMPRPRMALKICSRYGISMEGMARARTKKVAA